MFCTFDPTNHHSWKGHSCIILYKILCPWSSCFEHVYLLDKGWVEDAGTAPRRRCWHESGPEAAFGPFSCLSAESESVVSLFSEHHMLLYLLIFLLYSVATSLSSRHSGALFCGTVSDCRCSEPVHFGVQGAVVVIFMHFDAGRAYTDVSFGEMLMSMFCN